jgi:hypothetical protein
MDHPAANPIVLILRNQEFSATTWNGSFWAGSRLSTLSYRAIGLVRENATSFFMQRILFLQLSHSPRLHSKDLHSNSHCESSGGVFATKGPLTKFLNPSNSLAIPTPS